MQTLKKMRVGGATRDLQAAGTAGSKAATTGEAGNGIVRRDVGTASVRLWFREAGMPAGGHAVPGMHASRVCRHVFLSLHRRPWDVRL